MEKDKLITCSSCGARISTDVDQCGLCGWPIGQYDHDMNEDAASKGEGSSAGQAVGVSENDGPFCHMCGWQNPSGARFCSACGKALQSGPSAEQATLPKEEDAPALPEKPGSASVPAEKQKIQGVHIGLMIAAGMLVVAALYMITAFSKKAFPEVESGPAQSQAAVESQNSALPADVASRITALEEEAAALTGDARIMKKREIVSLLVGGERQDKAAAIQEEIAEELNSGAEWFQAGHFSYEWMDAQGGEERFTYAQRAADAYEKGLELEPDDLNVRTALAMAYLNTRAPMQGVQQIRRVLDEDPDHLQGNFYYGVMLMQINRLDQAATQFARVKELVDESSPLYQQAEMMLQNLNTLQ